jgi:stringent starvation protein A
VLAEKGISIDIVSVEPGKLPEDLLDLNPYHSVPTLVDRDLVLYDSRVIIEYLDERFPHPPLMPVDPVTRAQFRLALYRIERDWYALVQQIEQDPDKKNTVKLKKILRDTVLQSTELFKVKPYFLADEFSLVDATIAPVLWRLPYYEIDLPPQAQPIIKYASLIFSRRRSVKACRTPSRKCALSDVAPCLQHPRRLLQSAPTCCGPCTSGCLTVDIRRT